MARLLADEDFPRPVALHLRTLGHDVQLAVETGLANRRTEDPVFLEYAREHHRIVLTHNRRHFRRLHAEMAHCGLVICTRTDDFICLAKTIDACLAGEPECSDLMIHVTRGGVSVHKKQRNDGQELPF